MLKNFSLYTVLCFYFTTVFLIYLISLFVFIEESNHLFILLNLFLFLIVFLKSVIRTHLDEVNNNVESCVKNFVSFHVFLLLDF